MILEIINGLGKSKHLIDFKEAAVTGGITALMFMAIKTAKDFIFPKEFEGDDDFDIIDDDD